MKLKFKLKTLDGLDEAVKALYTQKGEEFFLNVEDGEVGNIEEVTGLKSSLQKEREASKAAKQMAKDLEERFAGINPDEVRKMLAKFEGDGEAALIAAGKIDEVIAKRMEKAQKDWQKKLDDANGMTKAEKERANRWSGKVLDNEIRSAATKAGLHPMAVEDALFRARTMFSLDDNGSAVQLDSDGQPVIGKDGKSNFTPTEWLDSMKETAPHWFPASGSGGGAAGNRNSDGGGKTIRRSDFDAMTPDKQRETVKAKVKVVD